MESSAISKINIIKYGPGLKTKIIDYKVCRKITAKGVSTRMFISFVRLGRRLKHKDWLPRL